MKIYVVSISDGSARISSIDAEQKASTYTTIYGTQIDFNGWQYIGKRVRKGDNVFTEKKDALEFACNKLSKFIADYSEEVENAKKELNVLQSTLFLLNKKEEE